MNVSDAPKGSRELGPHDFDVPTASPNANEQQMSLLELFALTTFVAGGVGVFLYVSSLLALLAGGCLIFAAVLRICDCRDLLKGGLVGFVTAGLVTFLVVQVGDLEGAVALGLAILCPSAGYVFGALAAELHEDAI
jgi:hypothetical protein